MTLAKDGFMREFDKLTTDQKDSILTIMHLYNQANEKEQLNKKRNLVTFGIFKGDLKYISDDFDDTPEGFEKYM